MTSTPADTERSDHLPEWAARGLGYYPLSLFFHRRFGHRVWKLSIDAGLSCPNVDGTLGRQGCIFCDIRSFSPSRRQGAASRSVADQIADGAKRLRRRYGDRHGDRFVAYFQPATNTHAPTGELRGLWREAISQPEIVGLAVGTRPDCVADDALDLLAELAGESWVTIEFGLQSIHQRSLDWIGRGHDFACLEDAVLRAKVRGLHVGVHLILGLPGESPEEMHATAEEMARLRVDSVKLHNLYVVRETLLADLWEAGRVQLPSLDQYAVQAADVLERLPTDCVIDRLCGDAPPEFLLAPDWCRQTAAVRGAIEEELARRGTRQGSRRAPST